MEPERILDLKCDLLFNGINLPKICQTKRAYIELIFTPVEILDDDGVDLL